MKYYIVIGWLICGIGAAGFINASFQNDNHNWSTADKCDDWSRRDQSFSLIWGILGGPGALLTTMAFTGFGHKGWSLERTSCKNWEK